MAFIYLGHQSTVWKQGQLDIERFILYPLQYSVCHREYVTVTASVFHHLATYSEMAMSRTESFHLIRHTLQWDYHLYQLLCQSGLNLHVNKVLHCSSYVPPFQPLNTSLRKGFIQVFS